MNSNVISFMIILFSVLLLSEINLISLISMLLLVFLINIFIVSMIATKRKQSDKKVQYFELKTQQNINYYFDFVINKPLIKLKQICFEFISNKLSNYLTKVEKSLSEKPFCGKCLDIRNELKVVSQLITDNYVEFWYQSIGTDNNDFESDCQLILQKMFLNLFQRCQQKLDKQKFCLKLSLLIECHLNELKTSQQLKQFNETQRIESIIDKIIRMTATEEIACVIPNQSRNCGQKSDNLSLFLMIKAMLSHSVFIPIIDIISEQNFIYENLFYLITNTDLKLKFNTIEYQLKDRNKIIEPSSLGARDQIQIIDLSDKIDGEFNEQKLSKPDISSYHFEEDNSKVTDMSGNESIDELIVEAIEADEEMDEKAISNLVITKTEEIKDSYNSSYILYFISYDGLFQHIIDSQSSGNSSTKVISLFKRQISVHRRFSEFISLQKVLERNKTFKQLMKGIKKPSSIQITAQNLLIFAGSGNTRLDSSTVEFRRIYLQNFLKQLCNLKAIIDSQEFQQFLAYGSDGSIAFVNNNPNNILPLYIDKVLYKGMRGAISIMKSALPIEPQIGKIDPKFSERTIPENEKLTIKSIDTNIESNSCMQLEKKLNIWSKSSLSDDFGTNGDNTLTPEYNDLNEEYVDLKRHLGTRTLGDGCEDPKQTELNTDLIPNNNEMTYHSNSSLSIHTINCFIILVTKNVELIVKIVFTKFIHFIFGNIIERFMSELITKLMAKEMFVRQIHSLHSALWPTNESEIQIQFESKVEDNCLDQTVDAFQLYIKSSLYSFCPKISYIYDKLPIQQILDNILTKFQNSKFNKLFIYQFLELLLNEIE